MDETLNIPDFHQGNLLSTTTLKVTIQPQMDTDETVKIHNPCPFSVSVIRLKADG
ncbi:MAG: hypothetical protein AB1422_08480 [bacterium]